MLTNINTVSNWYCGVKAQVFLSRRFRKVQGSIRTLVLSSFITLIYLLCAGPSLWTLPGRSTYTIYILYIVTIRIYYRALYSKLNRTGTNFYFHPARLDHVLHISLFSTRTFWAMYSLSVQCTVQKPFALLKLKETMSQDFWFHLIYYCRRRNCWQWQGQNLWTLVQYTPKWKTWGRKSCDTTSILKKLAILYTQIENR